MRLAEFLDAYREAITEAVVRTYPPLYDAETRRTCGFDLHQLLRRPMGAQAAAMRLDVERVDQVLARRSHATRVTRTFHAARNVSNPGQRHLGYSALETDLGLSRTFRVDVDPDTSVVELVGALSELEVVEAASPVYLSDCPFEHAPAATALSEPALADWGHELCHARAALELEPGDPTIIVAIIDSGVSLHHVELRGQAGVVPDALDQAARQLGRAQALGVSREAIADHTRQLDRGLDRHFVVTRAQRCPQRARQRVLGRTVRARRLE